MAFQASLLRVCVNQMSSKLKHSLLFTAGVSLIFGAVFFLNQNNAPWYKMKTSIPGKTRAIERSIEKPVDDCLIPTEDKLQNMSHIEVQDLYHTYINSPQIPCSSVVRKGLITDGGWELCEDPKYAPDKQKCLVYSFGINYDFSYDDDMQKYGCEVHSFDPSMKKMKDHKRGQNGFFHNLGISGENTTIKVHSPQTGEMLWKLKTLASTRRLLGHTSETRVLDVVKMDVEGAELDSLSIALKEGSLKDVQQLSFETHLGGGSVEPPKYNYIQYLNLLRNLYQAGFRIYMTHRNYVWSSFYSHISNKKRVKCHEVHTVNINKQNKAVFR